jgi:hypothetical protein
MTLRTTVLACLLALCCGCGDDDDGAAGDAGDGTDTGGGTDTGAATALEDCAGGAGRYDPATDLCWQDPPSTDTMIWNVAKYYCEAMSLGGHDDWVVPSIEQLVSLVAGCDKSGCEVSDPGCLAESCADGCESCANNAGPGAGDCYWDPSLGGDCESGMYWSSSSSADDDTYGWVVLFRVGGVDVEAKSYSTFVRCVRPGK